MSRYARTFGEICEAAASVHGIPLPKRVLELGSQTEGWGVRFNATEETHDDLSPYDSHITYNGMTVGIVAHNGGILIGGDGSTEADLGEWLHQVRDTGPHRDEAVALALT